MGTSVRSRPAVRGPAADRTREVVRPPGGGDPPDFSDTSFELTLPPDPTPVGGSTRLLHGGRRPDTLDAAARETFRRRLRLCCLIAAVPFAFLFVSALTPFIDLIGYQTVGAVGAVLCGGVLAVLAAAAAVLFRYPALGERWLRVTEVAVFGSMGLCFAYWQFAVQTSSADLPFVMAERSEAVLQYQQVRVLASALIAHFNWLLLIVFHAVLVPNTVARGLGVTAALVLTPLGIDAVAVAAHDASYHNGLAVFAVAAVMLAAGGGLAVFGTAKTAELRQQVESAREQVREMGQYRLRRKLGAGGMGEVYLAEHQLLKRPCALKRIHARYLHNPEQLRRFEREVQATARLRHPNTVEIFDYGVAEDGTFYYVMEYLPGMSLEQLVSAYGRLPAERVIHLLRQVCGALREAHRHGLVHRDIKPGNVVVFPDGSPHDQVKLVDFGLVHTLAETDLPGERITRDGLIVGTPEYMSPEQASGGALDARSDLFSLGGVGYYLLTGREAFHRANAVQTLMAVVADPPPPVADAAPDAPPDLVNVFARCLEKDPDRRFATAQEVERALAACTAAALWTEPRAADWWAEHPAAKPGTGTDLASLPVRESRGQ